MKPESQLELFKHDGGYAEWLGHARGAQHPDIAWRHEPKDEPPKEEKREQDTGSN